MRRHTAVLVATSILISAGSVQGQTVLYVDDDASGANDGSSWCEAFVDLQRALDVAASGDTIHVADGTYYPSLRTEPTDPRTATFQLLNGVGVHGGYGGCAAPDPDQRNFELYPTLLSGDLNRNDEPDPGVYPWDDTSMDDNSYHVLTGSGADGTAVLDGFTVTAGNANERPPHVYGGGMFNHNGSPTLSNCTFRGNSAERRGGGIYNTRASSPILTNCTFDTNSTNHDGGGMLNLYDSNPILTKCLFLGNWVTDDGGGMHNRESNPVLIDCMFVGNTAWEDGGGINNTSGRVSDSTPLLANCLFSGNSAGRLGGGINNYRSQPALVNCTFTSNSAGEKGGGCHSTGDAIIVNCIFWNNHDVNGTDETSQIFGRAQIQYSCLQGWTGILGGVGNIGDDPLFVDIGGLDGIHGTEDDDVHLEISSPCIDAGDNMAVPPDTLDLDGDGNTDERTPLDLGGNLRFTNDCLTHDTGVGDPPDYMNVVDMGAYEYQPNDIDDDGDVDLSNLAEFLACFTGEGKGEVAPGCEGFDADCDDDLDVKDFALFQAALMGPH